MAYHQSESYSISRVEDLAQIIDDTIDYADLIKDKRGLETYNIPASFDIETTSFLDGDQKRATMYVWQFGLNGYVFMGRTWEEFKAFVDKLRVELALGDDRYLIVYVHNLAYEFQFLRKWFKWKKVFSIEPRKPAKAVTEDGIEFRCSYILSGYSLETIGKNLHKYPVRKAVGQLDYNKLRTYKTPLTETELEYCVNDVRVVMAYIQEKIESDGSIVKIPLTKTGYVRNYCRLACYAKDHQKKSKYASTKFRRFIRGLTMSPDEYEQLRRAFQGGFTHASPFFSGKTVSDVTSFDLTSSYPTVMVAEKFPMSSAEFIENLDKQTFENSLKYYCCLFDITFENLKPKTLIDNYLSVSHCRNTQGVVAQNGRVVSAIMLTTTITETDFAIIKKFYTWDNCFVQNFRRYMRAYLPTEFVKAILKLYEDKTTLKGVEGKELEYQAGKELLNSCYGMSVTDPVRPEIIYGMDDVWSVEAPDVAEAIARYNKQRQRFLFYPWGVWVTAYARRNLFSAICECDLDYLYSDTDSVKIRNAESHKHFFDEYNKRIREQLIAACEYHNIPVSSIEPVTVKGVKKTLGIWDFDGHYKRFKALGAKRYLVEYDNGSHSLTVSGLNKRSAIPYMEQLAEKKHTDIFNVFEDGLYIPRGYTGGMIHTYVDEPFKTILTDYLGITAEISEKSCIHLEQDEYTLGLQREYVNYILSINKEIW